MFRLLKLAAMALFGYALFEFVRGVMEQAETAAGQASGRSSGSGPDGQRGGRRGSQRQNRPASAEPLVMTGPGEGVEEATAEPDGATVRHKVGRGVIS